VPEVSPKIAEVLPLLYLQGLSSKDFIPALEGLLGNDAGLSAATTTRLTVQWQGDARTFSQRDLSDVDCVYMWADGIHVDIRLDEERLCLLVLIGVRVDGTKELVASLTVIASRPAARLQKPWHARPGPGRG